MVRKAVTIAPDTDVFDGIRLLLHNRITGAPVIEEDGGYLGMLSEGSCIRVLTVTAREASPGDHRPPPARGFMVTKLLTLSPGTDAFEAIALLLKNRFSGAPVVDTDGSYLGVFSEHYIMRLLINSAYEEVPSTEVGAFMNIDRGRLIGEETDLLSVAQMFLDTYYRRLPVLRGDRLVGQVSRRDVLSAEHHLAQTLQGRGRALLELQGEGGVVAAGGEGSGASSGRVADFMDTATQTLEEDTDLLAIAQVFFRSNRRRLPVLRDGKFVGLVHRRDLLVAVLDLLEGEPRHERAGLYLSAVTEPDERPILNGHGHRD